jgi:hypothetical protein
MDIFKIDRASAQDATASGNFGGQVWMQRLIGEQQSQDIELLYQYDLNIRHECVILPALA